MPLNGKNKFFAAIAMLAIAFGCGESKQETSEQEKQRADSLLKARQRTKADSLKATNPLLIVPPDSSYTGTYIDRYPNGIVKFRGFFRQGKRHGQWMSFYPTGEAWSEMHYDKGLRHGPNITYFANGAKRYEGIYRLDQRDSTWTYFDSTGKAVKKVTFDRDVIVAQEEVGG